jgi:hypothetical protein
MPTQVSSLSHICEDQCWIHHACKSNLLKKFSSEKITLLYMVSSMKEYRKKVSLQQTFVHLYWHLIKMPQISKHCFRTWKSKRCHAWVWDILQIKAKRFENGHRTHYQLRITVFLPGTSNLLSASSSRTCTYSMEIALGIQWVPSE